MNRQLKFRTWYNGRLLSWEETVKTVCAFSFKDEESGEAEERRHTLFSIAIQNLIPNFAVLQQYTGLKDEKGVEIYEGDILQVITHGDWLDNEEFTNNIEVKFEHKEFGESDGCGWVYIPKRRQIIGNIFETPELLKK